MKPSSLPLNAATGIVLSLMLALPAATRAQDSFGSTPRPPQQQPPPQPGPPPQPQQPQWPAPAQPGYGPATGSGPSPANASQEALDLGVAPTAQLHVGAMHGPTPNAIPGGRLVTTPELAQLLRDANAQALVFDVLGGPKQLPNAIAAVPASQPGNFQDQTQQQFGQFLQQATQGRKDRPMVFYCQSTQCWMSYNAALRAINLGYTRVLWYRGGIEAWEQAGLPLGNAGYAPGRQ
ncbi:MAG: rhodanese-like domain-containing protein [Arenimonas sp.]|uniref:rhodanese-like domain-containing protein n=1 Tax=Arenimonas sp. TaxID=1872635 RepID=UPI0025BEF464|nr:rhodanese-like domain-containing protein [Arenimonas sp.]MBW8368652.1 rhodanese-like domain-containing protein [Arenimonas sp.]